MLTVPREMVQAIVGHARRDHPDECCGVISSRGGAASRLFEMDNAERSPTGFTFDSAQWLQVYRDIDDADEDLWIVYHSHTMTEAFPSRTDIRWSQTAGFPYWLLVSTRTAQDEIRAFTIENGIVTEVDVAQI